MYTIEIYNNIEQKKEVYKEYDRDKIMKHETMARGFQFDYTITYPSGYKLIAHFEND